MVIIVRRNSMESMIDMGSFSGNSVMAKSYLDLANASNDKSIDDIEKAIITEANMASIHQQSAMHAINIKVSCKHRGARIKLSMYLIYLQGDIRMKVIS